jgi:aminopeptidase N
MKHTGQFLAIWLSLFVFSYCAAQPLQPKPKFTRYDTLRGSITPERAWWDVTHYDITVEPDYNTKTIKGKVMISFKVLKAGNRMQLDLQQPMEINSLSWNNYDLSYKRDSNVFIITFPQQLPSDSRQHVFISFSGKPREAVRPPWDGGWIWKKDKFGNPWMTVACQGLGASVWFPCKDHQSDEPESVDLRMTIPDSLVAITNGRLKAKEVHTNHTATYHWAVKNPINSYNIIPYIGKYSSFYEAFAGEKGKLDVTYWVLDYHVDSARKHMREDVNNMLKAFEHWFGPYPFYEDGYKLVEAPHLGMEHQSAIAYGNQFKKGYAGKDLSGTGWGLKWDFIIIHESGHEWFGNNITTKDIADMWVHEGFTNYSETLFTEYVYGKEAGSDYITGVRKLIENEEPIVGHYGVNNEGSADMYYKGGNMLHTIRQVINDDEKFRSILRGLNKDFYHQTVTGAQVEKYISVKSGIDFSRVFDQYLRTVQIPVLEYKVEGNRLSYRWANAVKGFKMPVKIIADKARWLKPSDKWQTLVLPGAVVSEVTLDRNFYVELKKL